MTELPNWTLLKIFLLKLQEFAHIKCPLKFIEISGSGCFIVLKFKSACGRLSAWQNAQTVSHLRPETPSSLNKRKIIQTIINSNQRWINLLRFIWCKSPFAGWTDSRDLGLSFRFLALRAKSERAEGASLGMRGGWFPSSLSTSLPNALSPAPLTEFLINDEMWYK